MNDSVGERKPPLTGLRVLDLTRVLAGPVATQILGDLGADILKVEQPGAGDQTRGWGPPYVLDANGKETTESAYYLSANRNKRSVAIDLACADGQALIGRLLEHCDILVENFKVGGLSKYGLSYHRLKDRHPGLLYCSVTGYGQSGPDAAKPGYDYQAQGLGGLMSVTGPLGGEPTKTGVAVADIVTGMNGVIGLLAALHHRGKTGRGQHIDVALLDSQVAFCTYAASYYLTSGRPPARQGNGHPTIVPYNTYEASDGSHVILSAANDSQFRKFCDFVERPDLKQDTRFVTNDARVRNRKAIDSEIAALFARRPSDWWIEGLTGAQVPVAKVNDMEQVFDEAQLAHREMRVALPHPLAGSGYVDLVGSPLKLSHTPVAYRNAPPMLGQHTDEVLRELLNAGDKELKSLRERGVIG